MHFVTGSLPLKPGFDLLWLHSDVTQPGDSVSNPFLKTLAKHIQKNSGKASAGSFLDPHHICEEQLHGVS